MNIIKWIVAGLTGGLVGAAVWAGVVYFTNYEIGWFASLVGALAGFGVRYAAAPQIGRLSGGVAVAVALLCVALGKYAVVELEMRKFYNPAPLTDEHIIALMASNLMDEKFDAGQPVNWPKGVDPEQAEKQSDFPPEIWSEAEANWKSMTPEGKQEMLREFDELVAQSRLQVANQAFLASFTGFDLLWFGLAALASWRLGSGQNRAA